MKSLFTVLLLATLVFYGCKEDDIPPSFDHLTPFIGDHSAVSVHISGIHTFYDSVGNITGQGERVWEMTDNLISIRQIGNTDSLIINGLIKSFSTTSFRQEVKAIVENDSLTILFEKPTFQTRNNYIKGKVWVEGDSLFLNYRWNTSDIWSTGALPEYGRVTGRGIRL